MMAIYKRWLYRRRVRSAIADRLQVPVRIIEPSNRLDGLGLDSLDVLDVINEVRGQSELDKRTLWDLATVEDVVRVVAA